MLQKAAGCGLQAAPLPVASWQLQEILSRMRHLVARLLERPVVYRAWQAPFVDEKFAPVARALEQWPPRRVLDVGCGPGTNAARFAAAEYVGLDINPRYLEVARSQHAGTFVCADLATADLSHLGAFDTVLVNSVLHHLPDDAVKRLLARLVLRLASGARVHVLELVQPDRPSLPSLMAHLDRGRHARSLSAWRALLEAHLDIEVFAPYRFGFGLWAMVHVQGKGR